MYTIVRAFCIDQALTVASVPVIASGGNKDTRIEVTFSEEWDGLGKTAIFYRQEDQIYHVVMEADTVVIPKAVMVTEGTLYFGITGTDGTQTRTSQVVALPVHKGARIMSNPLEPVPSVYTQILAALGSMEQAIAVERARITSLAQLEEGSTTGDAELIDGRVGADGVEYDSIGEAIRTQIENIYAGQFLRGYGIANEEQGDFPYTDADAFPVNSIIGIDPDVDWIDNLPTEGFSGTIKTESPTTDISDGYGIQTAYEATTGQRLFRYHGSSGWGDWSVMEG